MVVKFRKGASPGRVVAMGEVTPEMAAIRYELADLKGEERVVALERMIFKNAEEVARRRTLDPASKGEWDQRGYDLQVEYDQACMSYYGPGWYKYKAEKARQLQAEKDGGAQ